MGLLWSKLIKYRVIRRSGFLGGGIVLLDEQFVMIQRHCNPPKYRWPLTQQHSITAQKNWMFSNTAVKTSYTFIVSVLLSFSLWEFLSACWLTIPFVWQLKAMRLAIWEETCLKGPVSNSVSATHSVVCCTSWRISLLDKICFMCLEPWRCSWDSSSFLAFSFILLFR